MSKPQYPIHPVEASQWPGMVASGSYIYPPGLRMPLPFYALHGFFRPANPLLLFTHLTKFGRAAHYRVFMHDVVVLREPADIQEVLIDKAASFEKDRTQKRMKILLGEGMITADGEKHRRGRRIAAPAFHRRRIERYAAQIVEIAAGMSMEWKHGQPLNIAAEMMRLALQITARTLFDTAVSEEILVINEQVNIIMDLYTFLVALPRAEHLLNSPLPQMRRFRAAKRRLDQVVDGMIRARSEEARTRLGKSEDHGDLLSMLLAARDNEASGDGSKLTAEELRDQVLTLFLAGYETVANALAWTWLLLGQNPEAEARLHSEIDSVLGDRLPTLEDMPSLEYTAMVLSESMRLYPPAWAMGRQAVEDVAIGPYRLRKGTMVFFSQYIVHRDPRWFTDAEAFRPERFSPENKAQRPRFAYFPFGGGGRQCIGESFAWMEALLALATLSRRWRFQVDGTQKIELQPKITLRPRNGIKVTAFART